MSVNKTRCHFSELAFGSCSHLCDPNCFARTTVTAVFNNPTNSEEIEKSLEKVRGSKDWMIPVTIVAIGEFRKSDDFARV